MIFDVKNFHTSILPEIWITVERLVEEKVTRQKFFFAGIKTYDPLSGMGLLGNVINRVLGSCLIQEYFSVQQHRQFFNLEHATTKVFVEESLARISGLWPHFWKPYIFFKLFLEVEW